MMIKRSRCSGIDLNAIRIHPYGIMAVEKFYRTVRVVRPRFVKDVEERLVQFNEPALIGSRTKNDSDVFMTLQSAATVAEFEADPEGWVYDALLSCAQRDSHYQYDKEW